MKISSLAAMKVVILTTFGTASDENFVKMMTISFQWTSTHRDNKMSLACQPGLLINVLFYNIRDYIRNFAESYLQYVTFYREHIK